MIVDRRPGTLRALRREDQMFKFEVKAVDDGTHDSEYSGLIETIEFHVNHERKLVESNHPDIWMRDYGRDCEPATNLMLHWSSREISVVATNSLEQLGKKANNQAVWNCHWLNEQIGSYNITVQREFRMYNFKSAAERVCAASLILKALQVYGGTFNWPVLPPPALPPPEYRKITAELHPRQKEFIYGELN